MYHKKWQIYIILIQIGFLSFITRATPTLRFVYQPLDDPYCHFISTINILRYGTLDPILSWWYSMTGLQLTWPAMHLNSVFALKLTSASTVEFLRYQEPVFGIIFVLGIFVISKIVTNNNSIALISTLLASMGDSILFYQSEYHPQGLGFLFFIFVLISFFWLNQRKNNRYYVLAIIFIITLSITHYFSGLMVAIIFSIVTFIAIFLFVLKNMDLSYFKKLDRLLQNLPTIKPNITFFIIICLIMVFTHLFVNSTFMAHANYFLSVLEPSGKLITTGTILQGENIISVPIYVTFFNSTKYVILILGGISILYIFRSKNKNELICCFFILAILLLGGIGTFFTVIPVDRLIGFYLPLICIFAALTIFRAINDWLPNIPTKIKKIFFSIVIVVLILSGIFNFFAPGMILHTSEPSPFHWHNNEFSELSEKNFPESWLKCYCNNIIIDSTEPILNKLIYFYREQISQYRPYVDYTIYMDKKLTITTKSKSVLLTCNKKAGEIFDGGKYSIII